MKNRLRGTSPVAQALVSGLGAVVAVLALAVGGPASAAAATTVLSSALVVETSPPPVPAASPNEAAIGPPAVCTDWYFREGSEYMGHSGRWEFNCMWGDWWSDWYVEEYFWRSATEEIRLAGWAFGWDGLPGAHCRLNDVGPTYCDL